jgi:hypothetical protein
MILRYVTLDGRNATAQLNKIQEIPVCVYDGNSNVKLRLRSTIHPGKDGSGPQKL